MVVKFQTRRDRMISGLNVIPGISCQIPQGAFYAFPNISSFGIPSKELSMHILDQAGVALLSGTDFGKHGEGYLRLCYANSMENIERALERLTGFFAELNGWRHWEVHLLGPPDNLCKWRFLVTVVKLLLPIRFNQPHRLRQKNNQWVEVICVSFEGNLRIVTGQQWWLRCIQCRSHIGALRGQTF